MAQWRFPGVIFALAAIILVLPVLAQGAVLSTTFTFLPPGTNTDLTSEGKLDWVHWGIYTEKTFTRKYGVPAQITYAPIVNSKYDGPYWQADAGNSVYWTDGNPTLTSTNSPRSIFFIGVGSGFRITCPADTTLKTLRLYVGAPGARARFTANLSGGGVPGVTNTAYANWLNSSNAVFKVDFQATSASQTLTVNFTMDTNLVSNGDVLLQAATLTGANLPPSVSITSPADGTVLVAPAAISISAGATGANPISSLQVSADSTSLGSSSSSPLTVTLPNPSIGVHLLTASATDARGLSITSSPVRVYVTTGGGMLKGSLSVPPTNVDLTAEGQIDWAHWGLSSSSNYDHKTGVVPQLSDLAPISGRTRDLEQYSDNLSGYFWTDGTPTTAASDTHTGIFVYGADNGFDFSVPAGRTPKQLKVYVGLYGAQGKLEAALSDDSGPVFTDSSVASGYDNAYAVYTMNFASRSEPANLLVRWSPITLFDQTYGNVTWQAATLAPVPFISCSANLTVALGTGWDFTPPVPFDPSATNVTISIVSTTTNSLGCSGFTATRTWQATRLPGESTNCTQTVTVLNTNPPILKLLSSSADLFVFSFCARTNTNYGVEYANTWGNNWQEFTNIQGNGAEAVVTHSGAAGTQRFYRVRVK